jgi:hypothetical protein
MYTAAKHGINGEWQAIGPQTPSINPADGKPIGSYFDGGEAAALRREVVFLDDPREGDVAPIADRLTDGGSSPEDIYETMESRELLRRTISQLPPKFGFRASHVGRSRSFHKGNRRFVENQCKRRKVPRQACPDRSETEPARGISSKFIRSDYDSTLVRRLD